MIKKIIILTNNVYPLEKTNQDIGILFETSKDTLSNFQNYIPVTKLIGHEKKIRKKACETMKKLISNEPYLRGVPQLSVFQESVSAELEKAYHVIFLYNFLIKNNYKICQFMAPSWWGYELIKLSSYMGNTLNIVIPPSSKKNLINKLFNRLLTETFSFDIFKKELNYALNKFDLFHRRKILFNKWKNLSCKTNSTWFYTTAETYTNSGLNYEPFFPDSFSFLVENDLTGGKPLKNYARAFHNLYNFALLEFIPSHKEIIESANIIFQHMSSVKLENTEKVAFELLKNSLWLGHFYTKSLAYGLFSSSIFNRWIQLSHPKALVVGNSGFEDYALYKAREFKIPTILLQHGVLSEYFPFLNHPVDKYIVRGQFFFERLSPISQKRALILNFSKTSSSNNTFYKKNNIVFVTAPFYQNAYALNINLDSILTTLIIATNEANVPLVIRVHPREKITFYKHKIKNLQKQLLIKNKIIYSQGSGLEDLFKNASVFIMFISTLFLDCIKYKIPMISFDWHNFSFKNNLKNLSILHFAKDLQDLKKLVLEASLGTLPPPSDSFEYFLDNISSKKISHVNI